jgi:hypothetical protein
MMLCAALSVSPDLRGVRWVAKGSDVRLSDSGFRSLQADIKKSSHLFTNLDFLLIDHDSLDAPRRRTGRNRRNIISRCSGYIVPSIETV